MRKTWFIADVDNALGYRLLVDALTAGDEVAAITRSSEALYDRLPAALGASDALFVQTRDLADAWQAVAAVEQALAYFGGLDFVINNRAESRTAEFEHLWLEDFEATIKSGLFATINVCQAVLPTLRTQCGGHIINFGARRSESDAQGRAATQAAGYAIEGMTRALATESAGSGVFVTVVNSGRARNPSKRTDRSATNDDRAGERLATAVFCLTRRADPPLHLRVENELVAPPPTPGHIHRVARGALVNAL